ncbi:MAG: dihydrolipoyllysine-residue acetyltransferase [Gammaproteobacteria bacterium]
MEVCIPDIGDFAEVAVIEILVKPGDEVAAEAPLVILESDKATMDVPSPAAGVVAAVHIKVGDKVGEGTLVVELKDVKDGGEKAQQAQSPPPEDDKAQSPAPAQSESGDSGDSGDVGDSGKTGESPAANADDGAGGEEALRVPDIGDFKDIAVIDVLVKPGDVIAAEQSLIVLESDKATMDVPADKGGTVAKVHIKTGDKVNIGDVICIIATTGGGQQKAQKAQQPAAQQSQPQQQSQPAAQQSQQQESQQQQSPQKPRPQSAPLPAVVESKGTFGKAHAGPAVRRFARELGVDLSQVRGSARLGRIVKSDVKAFAKAQLTAKTQSGEGLPQMPDIDFAKYGGVEIHPLARVRKLSAVNLRRNWLIAPHVTQFADADITEMDAFRKSLADDAKKQGYKMTPLAFLLKAAAAALREFPRFNASLLNDGENLVMKKYFHIGVAVDTPNGLVVPVLRDVDQKGLNDIARELAEVSARAREGKLKSEEMRGGCFTISSLGGIGGAHFTPILNLPEAAILGVGKAQTMPKWDGEQFRPRLSLPLALSYDHRIIDGAEGARFITHYANLLTDTRRLAL